MPLDIPEDKFVEICEAARVPREHWDKLRDQLEGAVEYCLALPPRETWEARKADAKPMKQAGEIASCLLEALGNEVVRQEVSWYLSYQERQRRAAGRDITDDDLRENPQNQALLMDALEDGLRAVQGAGRLAKHILSRRRSPELPQVVQGIPVWDVGAAHRHDQFVVEVIQVVLNCGGKMTLDTNLNVGSLPAFLDKLRPHLPANLLANVIPSSRLQQLSKYVEYWRDKEVLSGF